MVGESQTGMVFPPVDVVAASVHPGSGDVGRAGGVADMERDCKEQKGWQ